LIRRQRQLVRRQQQQSVTNVPQPATRSFSDGGVITTTSHEAGSGGTVVNVHCGGGGGGRDRRGCGDRDWGLGGCGGGPSIGCPVYDSLGYPYWPVYSPPPIFPMVAPPSWVTSSPIAYPSLSLPPPPPPFPTWGNNNGVSMCGGSQIMPPFASNLIY
jgi:hypothetical protein